MAIEHGKGQTCVLAPPGNFGSCLTPLVGVQASCAEGQGFESWPINCKIDTATVVLHHKQWLNCISAGFLSGRSGGKIPGESNK